MLNIDLYCWIFIEYLNIIWSFDYLIINNNHGENSLENNRENMKIVENYFELGVVKKFEVVEFYKSKILIMW